MKQTGVPMTLLAIAGLSLLAICSAATAVEEPGTNGSGHQRRVKLEALFQWRRYFEHFSKRYSSQLEAMARRVYQLANTLRVYTTGLAYKKRLSSHYLALNHLSDRSPRELERMLNAVMAGGKRAETAHAHASPQREDPASLARALEVEIGRELEEHNLEHALEAVAEPEGGQTGAPRRRAKRSTEADRELTLDMLIQDTGPVPESAEVLAKMDAEPESNNPNYIPAATAARPVARSLVEQQEKLSAWLLSVQPSDAIKVSRSKSSMLERVKEFLGGLGQNLLAHKQTPAELPDEMFHDLRQTGCMFQPRDQGDECGACYAFAGVAMAEFLFCKETGKLYAFSEQYPVDCGKGRVGQMNGCLGALDKDLPAFVHNYGLELRDRYPYAGTELECPYSNETELKTTGYVRMQLGDYLFVPVRAWPQVLKESPIFVGLASPAHFLQYGGGVDSGQKCAAESNHAMLVVGHGREDGQEFWLMRNSLGVHWGELGYYKLAKSAPERCIDKQMGLVWGTRDARDFGIRTTLNEMNLQVKHEPVPDLNKIFT